MTNLCDIIEPFVSLTVKQRLSFWPECMSIITINRIKATNSSTSSPRIELFSISRFNQIVSISSLVKISATCGSISLSTSILNKEREPEVSPEVTPEVSILPRHSHSRRYLFLNFFRNQLYHKSVYLFSYTACILLQVLSELDLKGQNKNSFLLLDRASSP